MKVIGYFPYKPKYREPMLIKYYIIFALRSQDQYLCLSSTLFWNILLRAIWETIPYHLHVQAGKTGNAVLMAPALPSLLPRAAQLHGERLLNFWSCPCCMGATLVQNVLTLLFCSGFGEWLGSPSSSVSMLNKHVLN